MFNLTLQVMSIPIITPTGDVVTRFGIYSRFDCGWFPFHYDTYETAVARKDVIMASVESQQITNSLPAIMKNFSHSYPTIIG